MAELSALFRHDLTTILVLCQCPLYKRFTHTHTNKPEHNIQRHKKTHTDNIYELIYEISYRRLGFNDF